MLEQLRGRTASVRRCRSQLSFDLRVRSRDQPGLRCGELASLQSNRRQLSNERRALPATCEEVLFLDMHDYDGQE